MFTTAQVLINASLQEIELTPTIGSFEPTILVHMTTLSKLDISGCTSIDSCLFIDCVQYCQQLQEISLRACTNFTDKQIVRILINLKHLEIVDCTNTVPMLFCNVYTIVCSLSNLRRINMEPRNEVFELTDWKKIVSTFLNVSFGHSIMRILPEYGRYLRVPYDHLDEE